MVNNNTYDKIKKYYFSDYNGGWVNRNIPMHKVINKYPQTKTWQIKEVIRHGKNFKIPDGIWLFFGNNNFTKITTKQTKTGKQKHLYKQ